eukprot:TRINITY_DN23909_c0_g6_i1.p1 TRINITY_DN23909_c0_g6~~TRINITY_DN23909_c0_g6_i1.p1  ORF type:complete len:408 (-),score=35.30 TRINITY_DN23909_c0_g6_i1:208-1389(-)
MTLPLKTAHTFRTAIVLANVIYLSSAWVRDGADPDTKGESLLQHSTSNHQRRTELIARRTKLLESLARLDAVFHRDNKSSAQEPGSCKAFGCSGFRSWQSCQCNSRCTHYGSCCPDYVETCMPQCKTIGCESFHRGAACQCTSQCKDYGNCCPDYEDVCSQNNQPTPAPPMPPMPPVPFNSSGTNGSAPCLCVFDIDRTLTAGQHERCPPSVRSPRDYIHDNAYGGGRLKISEVGGNIDKTPCTMCHVGIVSRGDAGGYNSRMRRYIFDHVIQTNTFKTFAQLVPEALQWTDWNVRCIKTVSSPFVVRSPNNCKKYGVEGIRQWYEKRGVNVAPNNVYFFDDHSSNIPEFENMGFNAFEIGCNRHRGQHISSCGATVEEIRMESLPEGYKMCG